MYYERYNVFLKKTVYLFLLPSLILTFESCVGGGGGAGGSNVNSSTGTASGASIPSGSWGGNIPGQSSTGSGIENAGSNSVTLFPELDWSSIVISLVANGEPQSSITLSPGSGLDMPSYPRGTSLSGSAVITLTDGTSRTANLESVVLGLDTGLVFNVPYMYKCIDHGSVIDSGWYFSSSGLDLSSCAPALSVGWKDDSGRTYSGNSLNGIRGDVTLTSMYGMYITSDTTGIANHSVLLTSLGISSDSAGNESKPAVANLTVHGCTNYTYSSSEPSKVTVSAGGTVQIVPGTAITSGETVTITAVDDNDPAVSDYITLTLYDEYVFVLYKNLSLGSSAGSAPSYTRIFYNAEQFTPYNFVGSSWESSEGNEISYWYNLTDDATIYNKTDAISSSADIKVCARWKFKTNPSSGTLTIPANAFKDNTNLTSVEIPSNVNVGNNAFKGCTNLTSINFTGAPASLGVGSFGSCQSLETVTFPSGNYTISSRIFENSNGLKTIVIGNGITELAGSIFVNVKGAENITIPVSVTKIAGYAFDYCGYNNTAPVNVTYMGTGSQWNAIEKVSPFGGNISKLKVTCSDGAVFNYVNSVLQ